jgi:ubiquitin related modifier 1
VGYHGIQCDESGGLEFLFEGLKSTQIQIPSLNEAQNKSTMKELLPWIRDHLLKERPELFMDGETMYALTTLFLFFTVDAALSMKFGDRFCSMLSRPLTLFL